MGEASVAKARLEFDERQVVERVMSTYRDVAARKGLTWAMEVSPPDDIDVEDATHQDAKTLARLHQRMIAKGFLSSLGPRFLTILYRALIADPDAFVLVVRGETDPVAFIAGVADTGLFYKRFLRKHAIAAVWAMLPSLLRPSVWGRVLESLRYGNSGSPVRAELLSMAVAPVMRRRGLGRELIRALLTRSSGKGVTTMKVVVGAENEAAIALYRGCGFDEGHQTSVHGDDPSWELVWRSG
jgi:ribosomal protein S18 acetylase RimI-like enzyme